MSKFSKFIFIPTLALLLFFSIFFVGCSSKKQDTPPQISDYFQTVVDYLQKNSIDTTPENSIYYIQFQSINAFFTGQNTDTKINGYIGYFKEQDIIEIYGEDSNKTTVNIIIPRSTDYTGHKYILSGSYNNLNRYSLSCTRANATVSFDSHNIPSTDFGKFQQSVQTIQNLINSTLQKSSIFCNEKIFKSSDNVALLKAFQLPTTVTIKT